MYKNTDFDNKLSKKIFFIRAFPERQIVVLTFKNRILICIWEDFANPPRISSQILLNPDDEIFNVALMPSLGDWYTIRI